MERPGLNQGLGFTGAKLFHAPTKALRPG